MTSCPSRRAVKILEGVRADIERHGVDCGDRVLAVALSPSDHEELCIAEVWGLPVLAWGEVDQGRYRLLCEANGVLIPNVDTVDELLDRWAYDLQPAGAQASAA
jgi:hypothetical protein